MSFTLTKTEALEQRRKNKHLGKCSCYTKLDHGGYFIQVCSLQFFIQVCNPKLYRKHTIEGEH